MKVEHEVRIAFFVVAHGFALALDAFHFPVQPRDFSVELRDSVRARLWSLSVSPLCGARAGPRCADATINAYTSDREQAFHLIVLTVKRALREHFHSR